MSQRLRISKLLDVTSPGVTNVIPAVIEYDSDVSPVSLEDPGNGEAVDEVQQNELPQTQTSETTERTEKSENIEDGETDDPTCKSERSRRPPDRFQYI